MKKKLTLLALTICTVIVCAIGFVACNITVPVDFELQFIVDGEVYATIDTAGEETISLPEAPKKDGFEFDGWYWDENTWERPFTADSLLNEKLTSDMRVYAKWKDTESELQQYVVTFNSMGGSVIDSITVAEGSLLKKPTEPTYTGFIFNGWYKDEGCTVSWVFETDTVTSSITLYAGWIEENATTFTVTYKDGENVLYTRKVKENSTAENIAVTKEGHTFKGWLLDNEDYDFATPVTQDIMLVAKWEINTFTVTFIADGVEIERFKVDYLDSVPEIPIVPEKTGHTGVWNITDFSSITKDLTVTAIYTAKTYTASFDYADADGGNSIQNKTLTYGQPVGALPAPTKTDNTFYGWFYEGVQVTASTIWQTDTSDTITFTAKWLAADNGHAIVSSDYFEFTDDTTLIQDGTLRNAVETYDLRGKFIVSADASWRAFTSPECSPSTEITTRIADISSGLNNVYIMVENNTTYEQSVYCLKIYRNRMLSVPVYYNETVVYQRVDFEENVAASETESAVLPVFSLDNYTSDGKYYTDSTYAAEWTDDIVVTDTTGIYVQAFCHDIIVDGYTVTGINPQQGKVHLVIPETIKGKTLTTIKENAFLNNTNIIAVDIAGSVKTIGKSAFEGTEFFKNAANWMDGVLYAGKYLIAANKNIAGGCQILNNVQYIANGAFEACSDLETIKFPVSISRIGIDAFKGCASLKNVYIGSISTWCTVVFDNYYSSPFVSAANMYLNNELVSELNIPDGVKRINTYALCSALTSITVPSSVEYIGKGAFFACWVEKLEIPFIGPTSNADTDAYFGYIFGAPSYSDHNRYVPYSINTVVITGGTNIKKGAFYGCWSLNSVTIPNSVTNIEDSAFKGCSGLTSVTIPNSVTSIGKGAFENCSAISEITLPFIGATKGGKINTHFGYIFGAETSSANGNYVPKSLKTVTIRGETAINDYAFSGCENISKVNINEGVTSIGKNVFRDCLLYSVIIPNSVTSIGKGAFENCSAIRDITLPFIGATKDGKINTHFGYIFGAETSSANGNYVPKLLETVTIRGETAINDYAFRGCEKIQKVIIENVKERIGEYAFQDCTLLWEITIVDCNINIETSAFSSCKYLRLVKVENSIVNIGAGVFKDCTRLNEIIFSTSEAMIGGSAFSGCTSLKKVTVDENSQLKSIGRYAFDGCTSLTNIIFSENSQLKSIGDYAFNDCTSLKSIAIPGSVTSIGDNAFDGCTSLTSITIPGSVISIGDYAFYGCNKLTEITIPDSVTSIGSYAFKNCTSLTGITIPSSVTNIGQHAFYGCKALYEVYINDLDKWCTINFSDAESNPMSCGITLYHNGEPVTKLELQDTVSIIGNYAFYQYSHITSITIPGSVISIGDYAFYGCNKLTKITIPNSVTSIGSHAFHGCSLLTNIALDENSPLSDIGDYAFYGCNKLTEITIPDSVTSIGSYAFKNCTSLTSITIPGSVTSIGDNAFDGCTSLTSIALDENSPLSDIGDYAFYGCNKLTEITIPNSVTSIGSYAFHGCSSLTSISIPSSVTSIGSSAFYNCTKLANVTIGNSVTSIGSSAFGNTAYYNDSSNWENGVLYMGIYFLDAETSISGAYAVKEGTSVIAGSAFWGCSSLTSITIPDSVTRVGDYAFYNCSSLTSIVIPDSVTSIGSYAFKNCTSLTGITIPDNVTSIGDDAFYGCTSLTSITIPDNVTSIGDDAFYNCSSLTSIVIPGSVTSIGRSAFADCNSLTSITIPFVGATKDGTNNTFFGYIFGASSSYYNDDCVPQALKTVVVTGGTSIGSYAFYNCRNLTSVTIPDSVTSIGKYAFYNCRSLTSIVIPSSITSIENYTFYNCDSLESIYYTGTAEEWSAVAIGSNNTPLTSATVYCYSESEPPLNTDGTAYDGSYWRYVDGVPAVWIKETN